MSKNRLICDTSQTGFKMITQKKLLEIVFEAASCFIPTDELTREQKQKLDNIRYKLCNCRICKKALESPKTEWKALGHANRRTWEIGISRDAVKLMAGIGKYRKLENIIPIFLLHLEQTIVHEIIHILFPELSEVQVRNKTSEWLNSFDWNQVI